MDVNFKQDDDSDLEYEVEACPSVSPADAMEACNCVQVRHIFLLLFFSL